MDLGSRFRAAREQQGLTLEDLAARTKISRRFLADLELNDLSRWPKDRVYQIGFLRAYAQELSLNADEVVAAFIAEMSGHVPEVPAIRRSHDRGAWGPLAVTAATAALLFLAGTVGLPHGFRSVRSPASPIIARDLPRDIHLDAEGAAATSGLLAIAADEIAAESDPAVDGELTIESIPSDTLVVINGIARGTTPVRIRYLPLGPLTIRVVRDGYETVEQRVTLTRERPSRSIRLTLIERPK